MIWWSAINRPIFLQTIYILHMGALESEMGFPDLVKIESQNWKATIIIWQKYYNLLCGLQLLSSKILHFKHWKIKALKFLPPTVDQEFPS